MPRKPKEAIYGRPEASTLPQKDARENFNLNDAQEFKKARGLRYRAEIDALAAGCGDEFVAEGLDEQANLMDQISAEMFRTKPRPRLGPGAAREGLFLNRATAWGDEGVFAPPDPRLAARAAQLREMEGAKTTDAPNSKYTVE